jgi:hypothetical protein
MYPLSAVVPEGEVPRGRIVPVRLARKVAPLFGKRWDHNPFERTWLCTFESLTLAEIGRGAPSCSHEEQERMDAAHEAECLAGPSPGPASGPGAVPDDAPVWRVARRGVWTPKGTPLPGSLANATMNRYGPSTKAAVVLTGCNCLYGEATAAVGDVCRHLAGLELPAGTKAAVWAGLTLEVFRAHPGLGVAAIQARAVQRSLTARWGSSLTGLEQVEDGARSELSARSPDETRDRPDRPTRLGLLDDTLPLLELRAVPVGSDNGFPLGHEQMDDLVDGWCSRLLRVGKQGRGLLWVVEDHGHRTVHAYVRTGAVVAPFVETLGSGDGEGQVAVPGPPDVEHLRGLSVPGVRAHLMAVQVAVRYLRYRDELLRRDPGLRERTRERSGQALALARELLAPNDPVRVLLDAYHPYLRLRDLLAVPDSDPTGRLTFAAVDCVLKAQKAVLDSWQAGGIDPGTATYLTEIMNISLERTVVRFSEPSPRPAVAPASVGGASGTDPTGSGRCRNRSGRWGTRSPARRCPVERIDRTLARTWTECLAARGLEANAVLTDPDAVPDPQAFHLVHFAAHMGRRGSTDQVWGALDLMDRIARIRDQVASQEPAEYAVKHVAARVVHELAARTALALAGRLPDPGGEGPGTHAGAWGRGRTEAREKALRHAVLGLRNPSVVDLVAGRASLSATRDAARCLLPVLVDVIVEGVSDPQGDHQAPEGPAVDRELFERTRGLLAAALRDSVGGEEGAAGAGSGMEHGTARGHRATPEAGVSAGSRSSVLGTVEPEVLRDRLRAVGLWGPPRTTENPSTIDGGTR